VFFFDDYQQRPDSSVVACTAATTVLRPDDVPMSSEFHDRVPVPHAAPAAQTDQSGTEVFRQERVEDRIEAAVGVGETVGCQPHGDERIRDRRLAVGGVEILDDEDDVDRQPAGAERRHDDDDEPRRPASSSRRLGRPAAVDGPAPAATHDVSAQKPENHAGVQDADEGHRQNEGEGEERSVEDAAVVAIVRQQTDVQARRTCLPRVVDWIGNDLRRISTSVNPLECTGHYSTTSNNMKLVHWPLMGELLHLVQREVD